MATTQKMNDTRDGKRREFKIIRVYALYYGSANQTRQILNVVIESNGRHNALRGYKTKIGYQVEIA